MHPSEKSIKEQLACLALIYAVKGQIRKSERLRRLVRRLENIDQPVAALAR